MNYPTTASLIVTLLAVLVFGGLIVALTANKEGESNSAPPQKAASTDESIQVTDGQKHAVPLDEIISGGPGKDGIPSIDDPTFVSVDKASKWLPKTAEGIGVDMNGEARFYPYAILVWHEIVNDQINGEPVLVTYCPLCKTGIVFDPRVNGTEYEFGVSGKLWESNLLMYNRTDDPDNESLWSQVLGKAVVGPDTGTKLEVLPSSITRLSGWRQAHPDTKVLARPEDSRRNYNRNPYAGYFQSDRVSLGLRLKMTGLMPKSLCTESRLTTPTRHTQQKQ